MVALTQEVDILARTMDGEAEGGGAPGMTAVACVVMNRVRHKTWWGSDIVSVCLEPYQFSCWLAGPDRTRIEALTEANSTWFCVAVAIAQRAKDGKLTDLTKGADSFFAKSMAAPPSWAARATLTYEDDLHWFYRVDAAGAAGGPDAATVSVIGAPSAGDTADTLNAAELAGLHERQAPPGDIA